MLEKIAASLDILDPQEIEEYTLFYVIEKGMLRTCLFTTNLRYDIICVDHRQILSLFHNYNILAIFRRSVLST